MKQSKALQFTILYSLTAVILLAGYILFFLHIQGKNVEAASVAAEIEQIQEQNKQFRDLNAVLRDIKADQDKLNSYFVEGDKIIEFLEAIEATGDVSGADVTVRSIDEDETTTNQISELTLDLTAVGSWESLYHLLVLLETFPVQSTFDRIQLSESNSDEEGEDEWRAVFIMRVLQIQEENVR